MKGDQPYEEGKGIPCPHCGGMVELKKCDPESGEDETPKEAPAKKKPADVAAAMSYKKK